MNVDEGKTMRGLTVPKVGLLTAEQMADGQDKPLVRKPTVEQYTVRFECNFVQDISVAWLEACSWLRFTVESNREEIL